ncbi:hypothetical protein COW99_00950 [Candidatus Roizmanbacteria bacterium CG22_combo_CG10-13_8_21_14_all_38_20]|uniref:DUF1573 domain-containing protein n=1 Tax=Candidatus Roizmanbacteria bacterium CG22_combo_CG10-13_8_21_14_all_38_20 TaxID=1974862 RepID=A0A2H0BWI2_9BACT|nr:DUF1573 domain-containing protein [Candidatus Microgenomates bacterium]PIP62032.1 MAG: hypothetical protein COW99_00950 [Candidatus Roizmanbacteria bacterium CG22_combo_CG10-13_8_21_14_all_38_20]PJC31673.1 MAG: hypothetical protein CO050_02580 [Candidatus Roizmanbacteria bacterium CG_4_9_14_0_2_um_filter_38_17]
MTKDCCNDKNTKNTKKGMDPFVIGIVVATALLLVGVIFFGLKAGGATTPVTVDSQVELAVLNDTHDWGEIDIDGGKVSKSFAIENKGSSPLKLYNVNTSCMCTTAQLKVGDESSERYGMHTKSSDVFEVSPGEIAELIVEFDPAFHGPSGVGAISRTVTLETNDENNPTLSFQLTANVVKR